MTDQAEQVPTVDGVSPTLVWGLWLRWLGLGQWGGRAPSLCPSLLTWMWIPWPHQNPFLDFIFKICKVQEWIYVNTKISSGSTCPYLDYIFKNTDSRKLCLFEDWVTILFSTCSFWKLVPLTGSKLSIARTSLLFWTKLTFCWERFWIISCS